MTLYLLLVLFLKHRKGYQTPFIYKRNASCIHTHTVYINHHLSFMILNITKYVYKRFYKTCVDKKPLISYAKICMQ